MKLYKFRPLCVPRGLKYALEILENGQFWCSKFWDLNDPMEGIYRLRKDSTDYRKIFQEKSKRVLCSFSGESALLNPLMWGYYANGFKGLAIEIEVPDAHVRSMTYTDEVFSPNPDKAESEQVDEILCHKLRNWEHEAEYRHLAEGDRGGRRIGKIISITLGVPYPSAQVDRSNRLSDIPHLAKYLKQCRRVIKAAERNGVRVDTATMQSSTIEIDEDADIGAWYDE